MKRGVCILCMVMAWLQTVCAGEWQWAVTLKAEFNLQMQQNSD